MTEIERIQAILKNSQAVVFYWKASEGWPVEYVSENISMFGYKAQDLLSGHIAYSNIVHPQDLTRVGEEVEAYTKMHKDEFRQVYRLLDSEGKTRWIDDRTVIERDEQGVPTFYVGTIIDITEQKLAEEHSLMLGNVVNESSEEVYIFERGSLKFTYLNKAALQNIGFTLEEARNLTPFDIKADLDNDVFSTELASLLVDYESSRTLSFETAMKRKDGTVYPAETKVQAMELDGRLQFVAIIRDITRHLALLSEQEQEHEFVQEVIDGVADSVMVINKDYSLQLINKAAKKCLDYDKVADKQNPKCYEVLYQRSNPCKGSDRPCPLKDVIETRKQVTVTHYREHNGEKNYVEILAKPLMDAMGQIISVVESVHDITDLMLSQQRLKEEADVLNFKATHDSLTNLPNRRLYLDRLEQSIKRAKRLSSLVAVVFVDVDKFKAINDDLGHQAGDEVLIEVAQRLTGVIRSCDTVARMGGDEFTLILEAFHSIKDISPILKKLEEQFAKPISTHKGEVLLTLSIGASCYPHDANNHKALLHNADVALYDVKTHGRNDVRCFHQLEKAQEF
ncbi:MAG: diguanylate cyclase [Pseudomonadota bacterium]|nr:diguanylate cyclase [Pseudomonadota bacterium]